MKRSAILLCIVAATMTVGTGCISHRSACGPTGCGRRIGNQLDSCSECGEFDCRGRCGGLGPFGYARFMATCGAGCGKRYWNEWINDPPDRRDPCDDCGNWTGPVDGCRVGWWRPGAGFWGRRYHPADCGCAGHGGHVIGEGEVIYDGPARAGDNSGEVWEETDPPRPEPTPDVTRQTRSIKKPWQQSYYTPSGQLGSGSR